VTKTIAVMTGGGDCPGLNAAIRTVVRSATSSYGSRVIGIADGFEGLIEKRYRELTPGDTRGILRVGGTILGSSNRTDPWNYTPPGESTAIDATAAAYETLDEIGADALVVIGGDGTLFLTHKFAGGRFPVVGIPKTIDNDVHGTDYAIGFDSCVATVTDAIDKLHTTAESHHRIMLVEVMGRSAGWIALYAGVAGGADAVLMPERNQQLRYKLSDLLETIEVRQRAGRHFTIIVVAEGVAGPSGEEIFWSRTGDQHAWRLGGVCHPLAEELGKLTKREVRALVLGHLQRGGSPTPTDRILATKLAQAATAAAHQGIDGVMAGVHGHQVQLVPLDQVAVGPRLVPEDEPLLTAAEAIGMFVG
jgi:ATP-dependent phosphofructokinase / diphosphate-dependent phosphofructokinase